MSHAELREPRLHRITASPLEPCNSSLEEAADAPCANGANTAALQRINTAAVSR